MLQSTKKSVVSGHLFARVCWSVMALWKIVFSGLGSSVSANDHALNCNTIEALLRPLIESTEFCFYKRNVREHFRDSLDEKKYLLNLISSVADVFSLFLSYGILQNILKQLHFKVSEFDFSSFKILTRILIFFSLPQDKYSNFRMIAEN